MDDKDIRLLIDRLSKIEGKFDMMNEKLNEFFKIIEKMENAIKSNMKDLEKDIRDNMEKMESDIKNKIEKMEEEIKKLKQEILIYKMILIGLSIVIFGKDLIPLLLHLIKW